jgi:hypothetical protein
MKSLIQLEKLTLSVVALALGCFGLACFALLPTAQAVVPPPDGGYPGGNTAEGTNALLSLTTGQYNTAVGLNSLSTTTTGNFNTAIGSAALRFNTANYNTAVGCNAFFTTDWLHRLVRLTIVVIHYSDTSVFVPVTFFTEAR